MPSGATGFPFIVLGEDPRRLSEGGVCVPLEAAAALNVGDAVFVSAANRVNKGATANKGKRCGVVVGGFANRFETNSKVGTAAAEAAGQIVFVCFAGVVKAVADGVIAAGDKLVFAGTAGRVVAGAVLTIAAGVVAVTSTAANGDIISGDGESSILGQALTAAAAAGDEIRALLLPS